MTLTSASATGPASVNVLRRKQTLFSFEVPSQTWLALHALGPSEKLAGALHALGASAPSQLRTFHQ